VNDVPLSVTILYGYNKCCKYSTAQFAHQTKLLANAFMGTIPG